MDSLPEPRALCAWEAPLGLISHRSGRGLDGHSSLQSFPRAESRDSQELAPPLPA